MTQEKGMVSHDFQHDFYSDVISAQHSIPRSKIYPSFFWISINCGTDLWLGY
jgi:hypothetical protein